MSKAYGMVIDLRRCIGCHACSTACKAENRLEDGLFRTRIKEVEEGKFPHCSLTFVKNACMHCENAPCVTVCPTGASKKDPKWGTVEVEEKLCVGCGYCVEACPYRARMFSHETGLPEKCTLCTHRLEKGEKPACETTCVGRAIVTGDLNDPNSEINKLIAQGAVPLHPEYGTKPHVFYIPNRR